VIGASRGIAPHYELILTRKNYTDYLEVRVELTDASLLENYQELDGLRNHVVAKLQTVLGLKAKVTLAAPSSIRRYEGKAKRIIDKRNEAES
jgi:phenylacetate-CoA ligase